MSWVRCVWIALPLLLPFPVFAVCPSDVGATNTPTYRLQVLDELPHDPSAFTQGLLIKDGLIFESTGRYGQSSLRRVSLENGQVLAKEALSRHLFAEGLAVGDAGFWQLTWRSGVALLWDPQRLRVVKRVRYPGEGWGLARNGQQMLMSDGSANLRRIAPASFEELGRFTVCDGDQAVDNLNELEMVDGLLWANIWHKDRIARILPKTGQVHSWLDASALRKRQPAESEVLNGIAYDAEKKQIWLTGKWWNRLYRVEVIGKP